MLEPSKPTTALADIPEIDEPLGVYIPPDMQEAIKEAKAEGAKPRVRQPYTNPPPWTMSAYIGTCALFLVLLLFAYPNLRRLPLPLRLNLFTPYLVLCLPMISAGWAVTGIVLKKHRKQWPFCLMGLALSILTFIGTISLFWLDPSRW